LGADRPPSAEGQGGMRRSNTRVDPLGRIILPVRQIVLQQG
jgi:hypothetical protein